MSYRLITAACLLFLAASSLGVKTSAAADKVLRTAAEVLALSAEEAGQSVSISVTGVVTVAEPNWRGKFFVQDKTGGVFVNFVGSPSPAAGDVVRVSGNSHPGGYAPDIVRPQWEIIGTAPLPEAKKISIDELMSGAEDGQRVQVTGVVRSVQVLTSNFALELSAGGYRFRAFTPRLSGLEPLSLIGATVRLKGTAAASFNAPLRHILKVVMFIPRESDFIIDRPPDASVFSAPVTPLNGIAQYRRNGTAETRIRVKGIVTYQRPGEEVFLHDTSGGLQVRTRDTNRFAPGEVIEAIGFPGLEGFLPVLQDAIITRTSESRETIQPTEAAYEELAKGMHQSDPITLQGKLIDTSFLQRGSNMVNSVLTLQDGGVLFTVELPSVDGKKALASIRLGSILKASGICLLKVDEDGKMQTIRLLASGPDDIKVRKRPSWWTPERLLIGFAAASVILLAGMTWTFMVLRRNSALRASIAEKVSAQRELQAAHDLLETRVEERTRQLKVEMTTRAEAEVRFKATLAERTRLAQELHDTLEQSMTGIGLQLDTADKLFDKQPGRANHHLDLARTLMTQSQMELRRSIWDLRSRELEQFDLCGALLTSGRQLLDGSDINLSVDTLGQPVPFSEVVEENLLRIGQEAITNAMKHSGARNVSITFEYAPVSVILRIRDDGHGFNPINSSFASEGHFGLLGMRERTKRLGGSLSIESAPGAGTCVTAGIPISPGILSAQTSPAGAAEAS